MTVAELIKLLSEFDDEMEVVDWYGDNIDHLDEDDNKIWIVGEEN